MKKTVLKNTDGQERARVYLIYGDEFLVKEHVQKLLKDLLEPDSRDVNLVILDGANLDISDLSGALFTPSLFGGRRVVMVDQTTLFMAGADRRKIAGKVLEAWKKNDRKAALRGFSQFLNLIGVGSEELRQDPAVLVDALEGTFESKEKEILTAVAEAFLETGKRAAGGSDEKAVEEIISSEIPKDASLLFTASGVDKRKKLFKLMEKWGTIVECIPREEKYGAGLEKKFFEERVRGTLKDAGKMILPAALAEMYSRTGKDLRRLHSELDKLVGYVGTREKVTAEDVAAVFSDFHQAGSFDLNNALRTGDPAKCLAAVHENLKIVESPLITLASIAGEVRRLMAARELLFTVFRSSWKPGMSFAAFAPVLKKVREDHPELMGKGKFQLLAINDYALYYSLRDAQKFTLDRLVRTLEAVLQADILMKSTRAATHAPEAVLDEVVLTLCASPASQQ